MLAIIPARGGSKGLPGKNTLDFCGKPLIAHTIEQALSSKCFDEIIVSTDDKEIAAVSQKFGAEVPFLRPDKYATDKSPINDTLRYTLKRLKEDFDICSDAFALLQPTSPLRMVEDIQNAIALFKKNDADSVIGFTEQTKPLEWFKEIEDETHRILGATDTATTKNRQEYNSVYYPNGAIYVIKNQLLEIDNFYTEKTYAYLMPSERSVDIDTLLDFEYAEFLAYKN